MFDYLNEKPNLKNQLKLCVVGAILPVVFLVGGSYAVHYRAPYIDPVWYWCSIGLCFFVLEFTLATYAALIPDDKPTEGSVNKVKEVVRLIEVGIEKSSSLKYNPEAKELFDTIKKEIDKC